jgi:hypothetical protein
MSTTIWSDLLSSALVGTDRRRVALPGGAGPLAGVLRSADPDSGGELDPDGLLAAAAVVTVARRAGQAPARPQPPVPAVAETAPQAPAGAQERLGQLLSGPDGELDRSTARELAAEWLRIAEARGMIAAPRLLVALLELGCAESSLRPLIRSVGGARLAWLCVAGPGRWAWAAEAAPSVQRPDWDTGRIGERARYLGELRAADPAAGRDLLLEAWPQEKAADLAVLVDVCRAGLGPDDEPWLEKALDDRRGQVREAAARLLGVLPGSAYRQRMADRALACVTVGHRRLEVRPPAECDAAMRRDGIVAKPPQGTGERAHWLRQVIGAAPLECWSAYDDRPEALLSRKVGDDWGQVLRQSLARAAIAQHDARWAAALFRAGFGTNDMGVYRELAGVLPAGELAELVAAQIRRSVDASVRLLDALPRPWAAPVAEAVLDCLPDAERRRSGWWQLLRHAEFGFDPAYAGRVQALADALPPTDQQLLARFTTILQIRHDIHQEFA